MNPNHLEHLSARVGLVEQEEALRVLFDAMPQLGWTARADGYLDYYNRGWYEYTGTTFAEMEGWGWTSVHHPDELARVIESWNRTIAASRRWELAFPLRRHDGVYRWFLSRATPIRDSSGAVVRWVGINTDIDDQRRAQQKLAELDRAKTSFFNNVSHELRTPLTLILGPIEAALNSPLPSLSGAELERVHRNAERLLKLVNTLLEFSRIQEGMLHPRFEPSDLARITRDMASLFRSTIECAGLRFVVDAPDLLEPVPVDREMWEKVVLNLLSNAFKFTFAGRISVLLRRRGDRVELEIADTGTGIPDGELPLLFERFHRVRGATSRSNEGSGIGLALVKELVELHGGKVAVKSTLGEGTTFTISIPAGAERGTSEPPANADPTSLSESTSTSGQTARVQAALDASPATVFPSERTAAHIAEAKRWLAAGASAREPAPTASPSSDQVLIVDDNADVRDYLSALLRGRWRIATARNGREAMAAIAAERPSLVLSDVMMPEVDGLELVRALRADPATRTLPVILSSARVGHDKAAEGMKAGANDYIVKPFSVGELVARVEAQIEIARVSRVKTEEAEAARAEAEAANRSKDEFLAMLGHELRNPLAPILTALHVMRLRGDTERSRSVIERQVQHLVRLIDDLLDISRITRGKILLRRDVHEIADVVAKAIEMTSPLIEQKRHRLDVRVAREGLQVHADAARLEQVVSNLIANAAKYTHDGGRIQIQAARIGEEVVLTVRDDGIGISPDMLPSVFELFAQEKQAIDRSQGGLGLGLAIVRSLVELHGGHVEARSAGIGHGAEFIVRLPVSSRALTPSARANEAPAAAATEGALEAAEHQLRVLVVDDNCDTADTLRETIEALGHISRAAYDGPSALQVTDGFAPDLALLDIGLPDMDGYELGRRLRQRFPGARLVAVTGYGAERDKRQSRDAGFESHLVKPINGTDLTALLRKKTP